MLVQFRQARGAVSIYAALTFAIVASLIAGFCFSARIEGARLMVFDATSLAMDSLFARYETELLEEYGLLLLSGGGDEDKLDKAYLGNELKNSLSYNIETDKGVLFNEGVDFYGIEIKDVKVDSVITPVDDGGKYYIEMVNEYAKTDTLLNYAMDLMGFSESLDKNEAVAGAIETLSECYEKEADIDLLYLELVGLIDGIRADGMGIDYSDMTLAANYVKQMCFVMPFEINQDIISIYDDRIFARVAPQIIDMNTFFDVIYAHFAKVSQDGIMYVPNLMSLIEILMRMLNDCSSRNRDAYNTICALELMGNDLNSFIENAENSVLSIYDSVTSGEYEAVYSELENLYAEFEELKARIQKLEAMKEILESNMQVISEAKEHFGNVAGWTVSTDTMEAEYAECLLEYETMQDILKGYRTDGLALDYSNIPYVSSNENKEVEEALAEIAAGALLGSILPSTALVSSGKITSKDLASEYMGAVKSEKLDASELLQKALFCAYLVDTYSSYADYNPEAEGGLKIQNKEQNVSALQSGRMFYELEYILSGLGNDRANLTAALSKIYGVRCAANLTYIFMDHEKKSQAKALAASVLGFTGSAALVKSLEYLILTAWSMGEAFMDLKRLAAGGKVPFIKTASDWQLSLENLLTGSFETITSYNSDKYKKGLSYNGYLALLILVQNKYKSAYRSMDLVELHMIYAGVSGFRLKNYVYGMAATVSYTTGGSDIIFEENCQYKY